MQIIHTTYRVFLSNDELENLLTVMITTGQNYLLSISTKPALYEEILGEQHPISVAKTRLCSTKRANPKLYLT